MTRAFIHEGNSLAKDARRSRGSVTTLIHR